MPQYIAGFPWSVSTADQYQLKSRHWSEISLNADHCGLRININRHLEELIGIERNWSTLGSMAEFWSALIGIGHWSREFCVHKWKHWKCYLSLDNSHWEDHFSWIWSLSSGPTPWLEMCLLASASLRYDNTTQDRHHILIYLPFSISQFKKC